MKNENKLVKGLRFTATGLLFGAFLVHEGISASLTRGDEGKVKRIGRKIVISRGKFLVRSIFGLSTEKLSQKIDTLEEQYYEMNKKLEPETYDPEYINAQHKEEKQLKKTRK